MPHDHFNLNDSALALEDKNRIKANVRACDKHLADLMRVHGSPTGPTVFPHPDKRLKGRCKGVAGGRKSDGQAVIAATSLPFP